MKCYDKINLEKNLFWLTVSEGEGPSRRENLAWLQEVSAGSLLITFSFMRHREQRERGDAVKFPKLIYMTCFL